MSISWLYSTTKTTTGNLFKATQDGILFNFDSEKSIWSRLKWIGRSCCPYFSGNKISHCMLHIIGSAFHRTLRQWKWIICTAANCEQRNKIEFGRMVFGRSSTNLLILLTNVFHPYFRASSSLLCLWALYAVNNIRPFPKHTQSFNFLALKTRASLFPVLPTTSTYYWICDLTILAWEHIVWSLMLDFWVFFRRVPFN